MWGMGLRTGDVIAMLSDNAAEAFEIYWAALRSGLYITAVNWHLAAEEAAYILRDSGAWVVIASVGVRELAERLLDLVPEVRRWYSFGGAITGYLPYGELLAATEPRLTEQPRGAEMLYSSGTTGMPKCIVHSTGGTLLKHLCEQRLHSDLKPGDRLFYFTTLGCMMWNWLLSGLASGATLLLYDGSPFYPGGNILWDYADAEKVTHFGTSAKYLDALKKAELAPVNDYNLASMRVLLSTGSPLAEEGFDYVYTSIKRDVHLALRLRQRVEVQHLVGREV